MTSVQAGQRYGRAVVVRVERAERILRRGVKAGKAQKFFKAYLLCDCGTEFSCAAGELTRARSPRRSCGCWRRENASAHMRELNRQLNEARVQVDASHPCASTHREAMRVRRFDPADPDYKLRWSLWLRHHITLERYNEMLAEQGGVCAICSEPPHGERPRLHVDHDHRCCPDSKRTCGRCVRRLLCFSCNSKIGWLETNWDAIMEYLGEVIGNASFPASRVRLQQPARVVVLERNAVAGP